jgi:hypothetical protein
MADATPPFFHAEASYACKLNRLYRVYVRPDELVLIWAGGADDLKRGLQAGTMAHGLIGALVYAMAEKLMNPGNKNAARAEVLDGTHLDDLIGDDARNMRALVGDFEELRILPCSAWTRSHFGEHLASLLVRHRALGKYRFALRDKNDVEVAMRELPRVLGAVCRIEIEWSEDKGTFVKRTSKE